MVDKEVFLIFSQTGTLLSKAINKFSESKYAHASLSFDKSFSKMYSFGRKNPNNPFFAGFVEENLGGGVFVKSPDSKCLIYRIEICDEQHQALLCELSKFQSQKNRYHYNFIGLFGLKLGIPVKRHYYYFCSQFVSELLIKSNIYVADKIPELIEPCELAKMEHLEFIYEGLISEYPRT